MDKQDYKAIAAAKTLLEQALALVREAQENLDGADHEEYPISHISWRDATPRLEEPIRCTGVGCNHTGEVNEYFIGWKDNTPVTKYHIE